MNKPGMPFSPVRAGKFLGKNRPLPDIVVQLMNIPLLFRELLGHYILLFNGTKSCRLHLQNVEQLGVSAKDPSLRRGKLQILT